MSQNNIDKLILEIQNNQHISESEKNKIVDKTLPQKNVQKNYQLV